MFYSLFLTAAVDGVLVDSPPFTYGCMGFKFAGTTAGEDGGVPEGPDGGVVPGSGFGSEADIDCRMLSLGIVPSAGVAFLTSFR